MSIRQPEDRRARPRRWLSSDTLLALALFAGVWVLRAAAANQFVTWDEPAWVYRSVHFMLALGRGDLAGTLLVGHPGVVTMWLGAAGLALGRLTGTVSAAQLAAVGALSSFDVHDPATMRLLVALLPAAKTFLPLCHALLITGLYLWLRRRWGRTAALAAGLLLAVDPYGLALSRVLHMDALAAEFMLLAVAAALPARSAPAPSPKTPAGRRLWAGWVPIAAGVFTGLATLTKAYGLFVVPVVAVLWLAPAAVPGLGRAPNRLRWGRAGLRLGWWALASLGTFWILWPAMWTVPGQAVGSIVGLSLQYASAPGDATAAFFQGEAGHDFGAAFYPLTILYRTTPLALVGALLAVGALCFRPAASGPDGAGEVDESRQYAMSRRTATVGLLFYLAVDLLLLGLSAKQFDRYALPAMLALDLLAALGLADAAAWLAARLRRPAANRGVIAGAAAGALVLAQGAWLLAPLAPSDYLAYGDPLLGGTAGAVAHVPMGWGEGIDQAAAYLAEQPDAEQLTVATWAIAGLAGDFDGQLVTPTAAGIARADYVLAYIGDVQAGNDLAVNWYAEREPEFVVRVNGQPYAWLYANTVMADLRDELAAEAAPGDVVVENTLSTLANPWPGGPDVATLADGDEATIATALNLASSAPADGSRREELYYVAFNEANDAEAAIERQLAQGALFISEYPFAYGTVRHYRLPAGGRFQVVEADSELQADFGDVVRLDASGVAADAVQYRQQVGVAMAWTALAAAPSDYHLFLRIEDASGGIWGQFDAPLRDLEGHRVTSWEPGSRHLCRYSVALQAGTPPGEYRLVGGLYRLDDLSGLPITRDGRSAGQQLELGTLTVAPALVPATVAELAIPQSAEVDLGEGARVIGYDLKDKTYASGESIDLTLYWQCTAAIDRAYQVELVLRDGAGRVATTWAQPGGADYPTTLWTSGQTVRNHYQLAIPADAESGTYTLALNLRALGGDASLLAEDATLTTVDVEHVERLFDVPDIAHPLAVTAGAAIELLGYDLAPEAAGPGETVALTLYWRARSAPAEDATVFVHLLAADGSLAAQQDAAPVAGTRPTSGWLPGEVIVDRHELAIPADLAGGSYRLAIGLYRPADGARLPLAADDGAALPDDRLILDTAMTVGP